MGVRILRLCLLLVSLPFLAGCDEDPRVTLCKAAITETVDNSDSVKWQDITGEDVARPPSDDAPSSTPDQVRVEGREYTSELSRADYVVSVQFTSNVNDQSVPGGGACKFKRDEGHGYNAVAVEIGSRRYDDGELDRLTDRYLANGLWQTYVCRWPRRWLEDCPR